MAKLPLNCEASYHPAVLSGDEGTALFADLIENYVVVNRTITMADGTECQIEAGTFLFADQGLLCFDKLPEVLGERASWSPLMTSLKDRVEEISGQQFQVCSVVYYKDGQSGIGFHIDPPAYGDTTWIASVSLGEEREFLLREIENPDAVHSVVLESGSLVLMGTHCQERYEHALPRDSKYQNPRINLTFRKFGYA